MLSDRALGIHGIYPGKVEIDGDVMNIDGDRFESSLSATLPSCRGRTLVSTT